MPPVPPFYLSPKCPISPASGSTPLLMAASPDSLDEVATEVDDDIPLQSLMHGLKHKRGSTGIEFDSSISTARLSQNSFVISRPSRQQ